jgi:hypothetical protein
MIAQMKSTLYTSLQISFARHRELTFPSLSVFVIAAARRYIRFFQFKITDSYVEALLQGGDPPGMLEVWSTSWFDLADEGGRRQAMDHVIALARYRK